MAGVFFYICRMPSSFDTAQLDWVIPLISLVATGLSVFFITKHNLRKEFQEKLDRHQDQITQLQLRQEQLNGRLNPVEKQYEKLNDGQNRLIDLLKHTLDHKNSSHG